MCQMGGKIILFFEILASTLQSHISCVIIKRRHALWGMLLPRFRPLSVRWGWCQISRGLWGWYSTMCAPRAALWWECRVHVSPRHTRQPTAAVSNSDGSVRAPSPHTTVRVGYEYIKSGVWSNDKDCHRLQTSTERGVSLSGPWHGSLTVGYMLTTAGPVELIIYIMGLHLI